MDQPWLTEPDELKWHDKETGLLCRIQRVTQSGLGHLCGYVAVPAHHPLHGKDGSCLDWQDGCVHGGITWSNIFKGESPKWWIGFDCAHAGDLLPNSSYHGPNHIYRDTYFVTEQCTKLARAIANYGKDQDDQWRVTDGKWVGRTTGA